MDCRHESSETLRNKCAACYRQYNKLEHLVEHMKVSYHSAHEPKCGVCNKHCRSFESLREHLIGPLPKVDCAKIFSVRGCNLCLNIFDSSSSLRNHKANCRFSRSPGLISRMSKLGFHGSSDNDTCVDLTSRRGTRVVAMGSKMVGGGSDGSVDLCARVCLVDEDENIIFHTFVKPQYQITNYRYETTGIRPEHLRDAMPLKQVQRKIQDYLCNGEPIWKIRSLGGRARILVGPNVAHDLSLLGIEYPSILIRDIANYPPLMKTSKLSNSLKYLAQTYLGYDVQTGGAQDPYEDCLAAMRLYRRMRSQPHPFQRCLSGPSEAQCRNNFACFKQKELERMSPAALLDISASDYYCWCMDSKF